jgi:hypothetical protein
MEDCYTVVYGKTGSRIGIGVSVTTQASLSLNDDDGFASILELDGSVSAGGTATDNSHITDNYIPRVDVGREGQRRREAKESKQCCCECW